MTATRNSWISQWQERVAPDEPHKLQRRVSWDGQEINSFQSWLNSEPTAVDAAAVRWQDTLSTACRCLQGGWDLPLLPLKAGKQRPFVDLWWPLHGWAITQLKNEFSYSDTVLQQLAESLLDRLCSMAEQLLWEQFSEGRSAGSMLLAHLGSNGDGSGDPVREHYQRFIEHHRQTGLAELLSQFPVFGRLLGCVIGLWLEGSREMLGRISRDRADLLQHFGLPLNHQLSTIKQGLSDPHRGGRAVAILTFSDSNGEAELNIVYKPKDMGVDAAYTALIEDLNNQSQLPPLKALKVWCGDHYGYMEWVPHQLCSDATELVQFYTNAGRVTALLHLLGCTDCHYENLIACGDQLLLIDTETLLEPDLPDHISNAGNTANEPAAISELQQRFTGSVLRSGLIPQWMFIGAAKIAVDISALGIKPPAEQDQSISGWLGLNTDGMMPGRISTAAELPTSLPVGVGTQNPLAAHEESFCRGFELQAQALTELKERWLAPGGALAGFAGLTRRIVLRATRVYFVLQRHQLAPAALRSNQAQALSLEPLARSFLMAENKPLHWPVFAAELQQMQQLDIPFFTHSIDSDELELNQNGKTLAGFIQTSGLDAAFKRLRELDSNEINFQLQLIRGALNAKTIGKSGEESAASTSLSSTAAEPGSTPLSPVSAAQMLTRQLISSAIEGSQGQMDWLGMDLGGDGETFSFGPVGLSLYGGSIGIAALIHQLNQLKASLSEAEGVTSAILQPLQILLDHNQSDGRLRWWRDQTLGLSGCGGVLLGLLVCGQQAMANQLVDAALPRFIEADQQLDLIGGSAGLIGPLLQLNTPAAQKLAVLAGERLLRCQKDDGTWSSTPQTQGLLGFSHGCAGAIAALAKLHQSCTEERFREAAAKALAHERSYFNAEQGNWPDFRYSESRFMTSWCHGAPGIGLGRAALWCTELWDQQCSEEITIAVQTTAAMIPLSADHLCCGRAGLMLVLDLLCHGPWPIADEVRELGLKAAQQHRQNLVERCQSDHIGISCFKTGEGSLLLPGWFTGLSGIAMALLNDDNSRKSNALLFSAGLLSNAG